MLSGSGVEQQRIVSAICIWVQRDFCATAYERRCACRVSSAYGCRGSCDGVVEVEIALYSHLEDEEDAEDFVACAVIAFRYVAREYVAEAPYAFREVVVAA